MDCGFPRPLRLIGFLSLVSDGVDGDASRSRAAFNLAMYVSIDETIS
jgi:hypothetical protein